ncbi:hypothetical protein ACFSTE_03900 [Aquimarina hainanensis]|uniref:Uncharacterized protein n=1 Tax=Aquimarina hainanensis TaxID=1578017 RepID=A0ABW5N380_9FLAO|nr:hypothetical protein [Aquimarina sp. TRL1]QKX05997.1 hypothetical protein HN014_14130 [Aquimarina sp. TRL1]
MPLNTIKFFLFLLTITIIVPSSYGQKYDCLSLEESGAIKKSFASFEKDLYTYYNLNNNPVKAYKTFLAEITNLSIDLKKFPSKTSIELARTFKKIANGKNSLWIKLSEYEASEDGKKAPIPDTAKKNQEEVMIFNYRGGFIQCIKNNSNSQAFKNIINTLELDGNVSPSVIAQRLNNLSDKEIDTYEVKKFIAFDIYYSILMVIEKAFG